jgi:hypothetical protein
MTDTMPEDPFAVSVDEDDPFASEADVKGNSGPFVPWPGIEAVRNRLVVLVPRSHDPEAKVSEFLQRTYNLPATREEWKIDLVVLDGGDLSYTYRAKVQNTENEFEEKTHEVSASDLPFVIPGWKVSWGNVIGALNKIADGSKPFGLGRLRAGYNVADMRKGKTFDQFTAEQEAFYAAPKGKKEPRAVWHFEATDAPEDRTIALAWWKAAKADGFKL